MNGTLYICGTPIGNMEDITLRCLRTLRCVDMIAAEDTRQTLKILNRYSIKTPLTSYHEHNKFEKGKYILELLKNEKSIALVSDAGMPGISDPGMDLIRLCSNENINVTVVPGPTAAVTALVISGIGNGAYCFDGFLPNDKKHRMRILENLKYENRTAIIYEAPHHLAATLKQLYSTLGNREAAVVKELTKRYEDVNKDSLEKLAAYYEENTPKGEFVIIIKGISISEMDNEQENFKSITIAEHVDYYTAHGMDLKTAMKQTAKDRGISKKEVYAEIMKKD